MGTQVAQMPRARPVDAPKTKKSAEKGKTSATILVVEDHPVFLKLINRILETAGFTVLPARNPKEAMQIEAGFAGTIDLLISEVMMMPDLMGTKLAQALKKRRPKMRIMLMSGYSGGELLILNYGWHFIQQPFLAEALVGRIKDVLESKTREQGTDHFDTRK
jgi:DNA-binding NtrC family response regulator